MSTGRTNGQIVTHSEAGPRPLYLRLRDQLAAKILDGEYEDGSALPSVRTFAAVTGANPLTVAKSYRYFVDIGVAVIRRGRGLYLAEGGVQRLREAERTRFVQEDWPQTIAKLQRLGFATPILSPGPSGDSREDSGSERPPANSVAHSRSSHL